MRVAEVQLTTDERKKPAEGIGGPWLACPDESDYLPLYSLWQAAHFRDASTFFSSPVLTASRMPWVSFFQLASSVPAGALLSARWLSNLNSFALSSSSPLPVMTFLHRPLLMQPPMISFTVGILSFCTPSTSASYTRANANTAIAPRIQPRNMTIPTLIKRQIGRAHV